jgi:YHS domain-containing protein
MFKLLRTVLAGVMLSATLAASVMAAGVDVNATTTGLALRGFDPVSYFTNGAPAEGDLRHTAQYNGATYRFVSKDNKEKFESDPAAYAPVYGGYCAFGTAMGFKFDGDPTVWKIVDNKLYLNLSKKVQTRWEGEQSEFIQKADTNWGTIKDKSPESLQN